MTKIAIQPNASGSGVFTIAAPNSNTNRTFTLPDATGEIITTSGLADAIPEFAPNAVIIESDENANGSFVKYSDGTMICRDVRLGGANVGSNNVREDTVTFAAEFIAPPAMSITPSSVGLGNVAAVRAFRYGAYEVAEATAIVSVQNATTTTRTWIFDYIAIGRWK